MFLITYCRYIYRVPSIRNREAVGYTRTPAVTVRVVGDTDTRNIVLFRRDFLGSRLGMQYASVHQQHGCSGMMHMRAPLNLNYFIPQLCCTLPACEASMIHDPFYNN